MSIQTNLWCVSLVVAAIVLGISVTKTTRLCLYISKVEKWWSVRQNVQTDNIKSLRYLITFKSEYKWLCLYISKVEKWWSVRQNVQTDNIKSLRYLITFKSEYKYIGKRLSLIEIQDNGLTAQGTVVKRSFIHKKLNKVRLKLLIRYLFYIFHVKNKIIPRRNPCMDENWRV